MSPEFIRNLWLEFPAHRLVVAPLVMLGIYAVAWFASHGSWQGIDPLTPTPERRTAISEASFYMVVGLTAFWGARLAADSVLNEVVRGTWPAQKMSAISPFAMAWGKLFGSTVFAWAGVIPIVVIAAVFGSPGQLAALLPALMVALISQSMALFTSLLVLRLQGGGQRFEVAVAHLAAIGLAAAVFFGSQELPTVRVASASGLTVDVVVWHGRQIDAALFRIASYLALIVALLVGVHRLMRAELLYPNYPIAWPAFVAAATFYAAGFSEPMELFRDPYVDRATGRLLVAFLITGGLTYIGAIALPIRLGEARQLSGRLRAGNFSAALVLVPGWLATVPMAAVAATAFVLVLPEGSGALTADGLGEAASLALAGPFLAACALFFVRDIAVMHLIVIDNRVRRGFVLFGLYWAFVYGLMPALLFAAGGDDLIALVVPAPVGDATTIFMAPLVQALLAILLLVRAVQRLGPGVGSRRAMPTAADVRAAAFDGDAFGSR